MVVKSRRKSHEHIYRDILYTLLMLIPMGKVVSYGNLAKILSLHPRKVAYLLKTNENPFIVPCHRVVANDGKLGGYSIGGQSMKKRLLMLEGIVLERGRVPKRFFIDLYRSLIEVK